MWMMNRLAMVGGALALLTGRSMQAEEVPASNGTESIKKQSEAAMIARTLGGRQFWGDVHYFHGWRIQQNVFTKHYRLINPENVRHASGSFEDCQNSLKKITEDEKLPAMSGSAVILIHGLLQSSRCMGDMGAALRDAGYTTIQFDYPSTQISIPEAARYLDRMVASLDGVEEINFVVHSMGGLVVRAYSAEYEDLRIKRMVMLGTPNLGAELADISQKYWLVRTAAGPGARQLGTRADGLIPKLPVPKFEFAVIAGSRGTTTGWNPLIPGDDDGTVTVASTRLPGAADFATVRALHSRLLWNDEVLAHTVRFLKDGRLREDGETQPITAQDTQRVIDSVPPLSSSFSAQ